MKKFILFAILAIASITTSHAQPAYGLDLVYDPGLNLYGVVRYDVNTYVPYRYEWGDVTYDYEDSLYYRRVNLSHFNDGAPNSIMWTDNGYWRISPIDSIRAKEPDNVPIASGGRGFNTAYQISTTKPGTMSISVQIGLTLALSSGGVVLEYSPNGSTWYFGAEKTGSLLGIFSTGGQLTCPLPSGYYWRARTTGSANFTFRGGLETTY